MSEIATRDSWKNLAEPSAKAWFQLPMSLSESEIQKLKGGHIPRVMEDKWFVFYENEWLIFCRSWTGFCIYGLHLKPISRAEAYKCWASRDSEHYDETNIENDKAVLNDLIYFVLEYDENDAAW